MKKLLLTYSALAFTLMFTRCDNTEDAIVSRLEYPEKLAGKWEHVGSLHMNRPEEGLPSYYRADHDGALFQLELNDDGSFLFDRFSEDCTTGNQYFFVDDIFGNKSIIFHFNCEIELQGELTSYVTVEIIPYNAFDFLVLSIQSNIDNCTELCIAEFSRVIE